MGKAVEAGSTLVVTVGWGRQGVTAGRGWGFLGGAERVLKSDRGGGCTTLSMN